MAEDAPLSRRNDPALFRRMQQHFRARRFERVLRLIQARLAVAETVSILDAGGRPDYWLLLPTNLRPRVRIIALNYSTELTSYDVSQSERLRVENVAGDACDMPQYADGAFDIAHSNSVIEHVGGYRRMARFAAEMRRVGRAYYIQTPNFWFPVDPHTAFPFAHWLPEPLRVNLSSMVKTGLAPRTDLAGAMGRLDDTRMISRTMFRAFFPDAEHHSERFFLLTKSLIAVRSSAPDEHDKRA